MSKKRYIASNRNNRRSECMCRRRINNGRALSGPKEGVIYEP